MPFPKAGGVGAWQVPVGWESPRTRSNLLIGARAQEHEWLSLSQNCGLFTSARKGVSPNHRGAPDHALAVGRGIGPDNAGTPDHARSPDHAGAPDYAGAPDDRGVRHHRNRSA